MMILCKALVKQLTKKSYKSSNLDTDANHLVDQIETDLFKELVIYCANCFVRSMESPTRDEHPSSTGLGQKGERATTLPIIISAGDTNRATSTSFARSARSAKTCHKT